MNKIQIDFLPIVVPIAVECKSNIYVNLVMLDQASLDLTKIYSRSESLDSTNLPVVDYFVLCYL